MKWDDYLFLVMVFFVVPGAIVSIARFIRSGNIWTKLQAPDEISLNHVDYHRLLGMKIDDIAFKNSVRLGRSDDRLIIKPGVLFRALGFGVKCIKMTDIVITDKTKRVRFRISGKLVEVEVVPISVLQTLMK